MKLKNNITIFVKDINEFNKVLSVLDQSLYNTQYQHLNEPNNYQFIPQEVSMFIKDDKIHWCNECYSRNNKSPRCYHCEQKDNKMIGFNEFISSLRQKKLERICK